MKRFLLKGILRLFSLLPLKVHYALGSFIGWLAGSVICYRKDVVTVNISRCFPDLYPEEVAKIRRQFYRHFGDLVAEAVWFGGCRNPRRLIRANIVEVTNMDEFNSIWEKSPGVVNLYSHCGNWELLGGIESYIPKDAPHPINESNYCVVYKEMSSKAWDAVMKDNRFAPLKDRKNFPGYIESKLLVRYMMGHRNEKKIYNINTDQRPYYSASDNIRVRFMYCETATMSAGAALAHKLGMPVFYQRMKNVRRGHYELTYVPICENAAMMSVQEIMDKYYSLLEDEIRETPWNYLWTHKRWIW